MTNELMKNRLAATDAKLATLRAELKVRNKARRVDIKQSRADHARKVQLVGETVLRRVASGQWDERDFLQMMDEALGRQADRNLFGLDAGQE